MKAIVDSVIRLDSNEWPDKILDELKAACHIPNADKEKMRREKIGGWQRLPNTISLWSFDDYEVTIPRGLAHQLNEFAKSYGHKIEWIDNRKYNEIFLHTNFSEVPVRDYQEEAILSILRNEQGYWKAPPGAGKTVAILEAIRRSGQKSLVIVNTTNIAEQWRQRARRFLGRNVKLGLIGDSEFDVQDITIAMQQTLWSKRLTFDFDQFGFVCLDECHHLPAETFTAVLSKFSAKYRVGVSGTPHKNFSWKPLLDATLGSKIAETSKKYLVDNGWLVQPSIEAIHTGFTYPYFGTHEHFGYKQNAKCLEPFCTRPNDKRRHGNNYQEMISALILNNERNERIALNVVNDLSAGHCVLVISRRLSHLNELKRIVEDYPLRFKSFKLTGKETTEERMNVAEAADKGLCVIFSTLADEALDIPRIDRIHLAFPAANPDLIRQQIGREERPHPDKTDAICYDYIDSAGPLRKQYNTRKWEVYKQEGLVVNERH